MNIYLLQSDLGQYGGFYCDIAIDDMSLQEFAMEQERQPFPEGTRLPRLKQTRNDKNELCTDFDISASIAPLVIFSPKAVTVLRDILEESGQLLPVTTPIKQEFMAFYPTRLCDCFDREHSTFDEYPEGIIIDDLVLKASRCAEYPLFVIPEHPMHTFVNEDFKARVEENKLKAFDWAWRVPLM